MTPLQKIIEVEAAKQAIYAHYGLTAKSYYQMRQELAETLPKDFKQDVGEYELTVGEEVHVVRRLEQGESPTISRPKLIFTRKQTGGKKHG